MNGYMDRTVRKENERRMGMREVEVKGTKRRNR